MHIAKSTRLRLIYGSVFTVPYSSIIATMLLGGAFISLEIYL